ncbi:hypothetical protein [Salinactinospora qingdaonensis]|uniref:Uncharacterized protein n=1 Tax=Salinactinospora qingdaonensis TaxID=702744 RepID=A0ABP7ETQ7_9ACTN
MRKAPVSKAAPLGSDLKAIVLVNLLALASLALFALLGMGIATAATGLPLG